jgi:hypothetical protein
MSNYFKELVSQVFGDYKDESFKSQYQLTNDWPTPYDITGHFAHEDEYIKKVCDYIKKRKDAKDLKPMIIFVEENDDDLTKALEEAVKFTFGSKMFNIKNENDIKAC